MPTSLVSTGVQFPDSTIQTTAATAGGSITAVASGTLPNGCTVVVNSNGTVSAIAASVTTATTGPITSTNIGAGATGQISATYNTLRNVVFVYFRNGNTGYINAVVGTISGTTITWGTPVSVASFPVSNSAARPMASVFDSTNNIHVAIYTDTSAFQDIYVSACNVDASNQITVLNANQNLGTQPGSIYGLTAAYNASRNRTVIAWSMYTDQAYNASYCFTVSSTGTVTAGSPITIDPTNYTGYQLAITTEPSTGKIIYFYQGTDSYLWTRMAQLPSSGNTITNLGTATAVTGINNNNYTIAVGYDVPSGNIVYAYTVSSTMISKAATISGYTLTLGSSTSLGFSYTTFSPNFVTMPGSNQTFFYGENNNGGGTIYAAPVTLSGTTVTVGSLVQLNTGTYTSNVARSFVVADPVRLQFIVVGSQGSSMKANTWTNVTTNLTSDNFVGFSSASYTNGQTATINVVGSVNANQSGLTAGTRYYAGGGGNLITASSQPYAGIALSATSLLVKG